MFVKIKNIQINEKINRNIFDCWTNVLDKLKSIAWPFDIQVGIIFINNKITLLSLTMKWKVLLLIASIVLLTGKYFDGFQFPSTHNLVVCSNWSTEMDINTDNKSRNIIIEVYYATSERPSLRTSEPSLDEWVATSTEKEGTKGVGVCVSFSL